MRLGELLCSVGLLSVEQIQQVLRAQIMWGGRFGTCAVELHFMDLDVLSRVIGRQHRLPAAFATHFDAADPDLQRLLSPELANEYACIPLRRVDAERVVVAALAPLDGKARALIADQLGISYKGIVQAVAAELRIRYHLERVYGIAREPRFLRTRRKGPSQAPLFATNIDLSVDIIEDADVVIPEPEPLPSLAEDDGTPADELPEFTPRIDLVDPPPHERRRYVRTLGEPPARVDLKRPALETAQTIPLAKIVLAKLDGSAAEDSPTTSDPEAAAARDLAGEAEPRESTSPIPREIAVKMGETARIAMLGEAAASLGDATRAIRRATNRNAIASHVMSAIAHFVPAMSAAVLLVIRGDVATKWTGFRRSGEPLPEIAVPLDEPGLVSATILKNAIGRAGTNHLSAIDMLLLETLGVTNGELVVSPIPIGERVWCVIALALERGAPLDGIASISSAAGAAFTRLIRDAKR